VSSWSNLLQCAEPDQHVVHLYGRHHTSLIRGIAAYAAEGLRRQEPVLIVATRAHAESVRLQLEEQDVDAVAAVREGIVRFIDAEELLRKLVGDGGLQWEVFRDIVGALLGEMRAIRPASHIRVFGEMVGVLWTSGRRVEAEQLETYWNRLQEIECFSLFCAYPVDLFEDVLEPSALAGLLGSHSHTCAGNDTLFSTLRERRQDVPAARL
jgi:hypothetical protein